MSEKLKAERPRMRCKDDACLMSASREWLVTANQRLWFENDEGFTNSYLEEKRRTQTLGKMTDLLLSTFRRDGSGSRLQMRDDWV